MADEDIVVGADTSGATKAFNDLRAATESFNATLGLTERAGNQMSRSVERSMGTAVAQWMKGKSALESQSRAGQQNAQVMREQATAAQKLAAEEKRVFEAMGLARNTGGRVVNSDTGRFASREQINLANSYVRSLEEINRAEELLARTQSARAAQASRHNATQLGRGAMGANTTGPMGSAAWIDAQQVKGLRQAAQNLALVQAQTPGVIRLKDALNGIPPVTWGKALNQATNDFMEMSNSTRYALYSVAQGASVAGAAILGFSGLAVGAAITHERAFANVERTTQTTAAGYEVLRRQLEQMSMTLPVTFEELTNIASAAGQLGIQAGGVANFTATVAKLSATTNLTSDAAGIALARFAAFFSETKSGNPALAVTDRTFSNLASSILKVGINSIASETGIVNVSTQISSMADYAGYTADQVIGLAGALSSVGVQPELARGLTTRLFTIIGDAASAGGVQLQKFADVAGVSSAEFKAAWGTEEFAPIFTSFVSGLNDIGKNGGDANSTLRELGVTAVRDRPVWLRLAGAADELGQSGGLLAQTMRDARQGWVDNSELALQYNKISQTTSARLQVMAQAFEQLFASMGEETGNFVGDIAAQITGIVRVFEEFMQSDIGKVIGSGVVQVAALAGASLLVIGALAGIAATAQGVGQAFRGMTAEGISGAARLGSAFRMVTMASGLLGLIATVATTIGMFVAMEQAGRDATRPVQDMSGLLDAMRADAESGATGVTFFAEANTKAAAEAARSAAEASHMGTALSGIKPEAEGAGASLMGLAGDAKQAAYVFGEAANQFFNQQLLADQDFQDVFNFDKIWNKVTPGAVDLLDWDALKVEALKEGGDVGNLARQQIESGLGHPIDAEFLNPAQVNSYLELTGQVSKTLADVRGGVQETINAQDALASASRATVLDMIDDYAQLDEATQKTVDNMTAGLVKFTDSSALIGLTQKFNEIMAGPDTSSDGAFIDKAAQWEEAWSEAYGGAAFSMEDYMGVFRRASDEQAGFIRNLQELGSRGLSTGIIDSLMQMGPEANKLVQALVSSTDDQLSEYEELWGATGFDSMVKFATQAAIGQEIINAVMRSGGLEALNAFNASLSSGVGVEAALKELQLDINGKPLVPQLKEPAVDPFVARMNAMFGRNPLSVPVVPYLTKNTMQVQPGGGGKQHVSLYANGGYTGNGGRLEEAGIVHRGEFVMDAQSTRSIGVRNLYNMMRAAKGGRAAPRGGNGYANGGYVGGSSGATVVELSPRDRALLAKLDTYIQIGSDVISRANSAGNYGALRQGRG